MTVAIIIASRGRPELLAQTVETLLSRSVFDSTKIVIGLDEDDELNNWETVAAPFHSSPKVKVSIEPREDSLGEKWNRCQKLVEADVYVVGCDDFVLSEGWDQKFQEAADLFTDGIGIIYCKPNQGQFISAFAATRRCIELMGYFMVSDYPFWWHDTALDEIGQMTGRIVRTDIEVTNTGPIKSSRGCREVDWWANFFERTRPWRCDIADRIIDASDDQPFRKTQLRQLRPSIVKMLAQRNANLCDPAEARRVEKMFGFDAPADERYRRIKARAEGILARLSGQSQAA